MFLARRLPSTLRRLVVGKREGVAVDFGRWRTYYPRAPHGPRDVNNNHDDSDDHMMAWRTRRRRHYEDEGEEGSEPEWEYQQTWRDWVYDRRKKISRVALVAVGVGGYYWYHLEETPITGRRRFMTMSEAQEEALSELTLRQVIQEYRRAVLPPSHPAVRHVERVARRIISSISPELISPDTQWRIFVVESPVANAFVLPGGEIFVFTGILPIAGNEDGLAAIIGHEVAHKLARHSAEKLSFYQFFSVASSVLQVLIMGDFGTPLRDLLQQLFLFLPFSRKCETEADYIGILLMAKACYDPEQAVGLWQRMSQASKGRQPPPFMSTHPSNEARVEKIKEWLPRARQEYENAGCPQKDLFYNSLFK